MKPILLTAAGNPENQDRGVIIEEASQFVLCVADGAGGRSGAAKAASMAVELVRQNASNIISADTCAELLRKVDAAIARDSTAGETTCTLAVATPEEIFGASVGDSGVWLILKKESYQNLSQGQQHKPFIGSGSAWPVSFQCPRQAGLILLATDGLLKYAASERIVSACLDHPVEIAVTRLLELVRYPSGALPDDVTMILSEI